MLARRPRAVPIRARFAAGIGLCAVLLLLPGGGMAQGGPRPPCGGEPSPAYAEPAGSAVVRVWDAGELDAGWTPPACTGWRPLPFRTLVAAAARFRHQGAAEELLERLGAISALRTIRYWSATDKRWLGLITDASALEGPDASRRRPDFGAAEMRVGADLYFAQHDNRATGEVVYRLRFREIAPDRLVAETENVGAVRYLFVPLAGPGDLQAVYFLDRLAPDVWGYYGLARTGAGASPLLEGHEASYVNRAVALFRHLAGLPTDQGPPAAP
jgi:hypothetical protein